MFIPTDVFSGATMELICVLARDCTKVLTFLSLLVLVSVIFVVCSVCLSLVMNQRAHTLCVRSLSHQGQPDPVHGGGLELLKLCLQERLLVALLCS